MLKSGVRFTISATYASSPALTTITKLAGCARVFLPRSFTVTVYTQGVPGPSGVQPAACTGGVPKALDPAVGLPTFNCSVNTTFPRWAHAEPPTTGIAALAAVQSAAVTSLTWDRITTLLPVAVML